MAIDPPSPSERATAWNLRHVSQQARAFAAHQREMAAVGRHEAAAVREIASGIRADAARVRDDGARTRDEAARVRDRAARVRDQAALARDQATRSREEALRRRILKAKVVDPGAWTETLELDRQASQHSHRAITHDREAVEMDRTAADKDRDAADKDRMAAERDREAADKDREAAEKDRVAADADRAAADSDRAESERDLAQGEERMGQVDRLAAMGRMAAGVAHEINNPLAALLANLSALQEHLGQAGNAALTPMLVDARLAADRIGHVVADMRAWLQGDPAPSPNQDVQLRQVVDEAVRLTRTELERAARVVVDVQDTPPVRGVASRLGQVLVNLLLNAVEAISGPRDQHEIRVTVREVGAVVRVEVRDTGSGVPADVKPHIFEPFFTTRAGSGGTGLGLALCQRIVSEHGGTLSMVSPEGGGTTFRLDLPASVTTRPLPSVPPETRPRVLLVDDDEVFSRSMERLLSKRCHVTRAIHGRDALERLHAPGASWHVILCDVMMPEMNGVEFYRRLQVEAPQWIPRVVFLSGGATDEKTVAFLADIPNRQLLKPFDVDALFLVIDEYARTQATPVGPVIPA